MPGLDKTGPEGKGAGTGWGFGKCKSFESSGKDSSRGLFARRGRAHGRRGFRFWRKKAGTGGE